MKKLLILMIFGMLFISFASASLIYRTDETFDIKIPCVNNGTYCSASALCNITVSYPSGSIDINNQQMTYQSSFFNYTHLATSIQGKYPAFVQCSDGTVNGASTFDFQITQTGKEISASQAALYIFMILFASILFLFFLALGYKINDVDERDDDGYLINVNILKNFKVLIYGLAYICFGWVLWMLYQLSLAYFDVEIGTNIFKTMFYIVFYLGYPIMLIVFINFIYHMWIDLSKLKWIGLGGRIK
jgi:hypothetical protein